MSEPMTGERLAEPRPAEPERNGLRGHLADVLVVAIGIGLVGAATAVGMHYNRVGSGVIIYAFAPPLFGDWLPHTGPGSVYAVLIAVAVILFGPTLAQRLRWRSLLGLGYLAAVGWTVALASIDGWSRGFVERLLHPTEYLHEVPGITDIPAMLRQFSSRILDFQPNSWTTHVSGHPPGATLLFVWLDRLGLSGGFWASTACVVIGCLVVVAVPGTLILLGQASAAKAVVPFAVLSPGAIWIGASADAIFAGVTAVGVLLLALACRGFTQRQWYAVPAALGSGLLLGFGIFLSYGLVLLGLVALAVVAVARRWKALLFAVLGALAVVAVFALAGFWWLDGYHLVVERYYQGIASDRPYYYWVWADVACLVIAAGPAVVAASRRTVVDGFLVLRRRHWAGFTPVLAIALAALLTVAFADLSGLSKAEVERIWLPFAIWLLPATALLPAPSRRWWLAAQAATALLVNHLVLTIW